MDRPGNAKLKALLKRNTSTSGGGGGGGGGGNKKKQKHHGGAAHPPSISSPDARAKAVELLKKALMEGHRAAEEEEKKKKGEKVEEEVVEEHETAAGGTKKKGEKSEKGKKGSKTSTTTTTTTSSATTDATAPAAATKKATTADDAPNQVSEKGVREIATAIEEELHAKWSKDNNHHEYNNQLRHLVFNLRRTNTIRVQVLTGALLPSTLVTMSIEDFRTEEEKSAVRKVEEKEVLGYSSSHVFSDVIFEEAEKGSGGGGGGGGSATTTTSATKKCKHCQSTKVLFSRRQSYNESSTWCGEEQGAPMMMNCLTCGAVESLRDG